MPGWTGKSDSYLTTIVVNEAFYPDLSLGDLQRDYRIPAEYETETVQEHLRLAMMEINEALTEQQVIWIDAGAATLVAVAAPTMDSISTLIINYRRAVFCKAKALLLQQYASMAQRDVAENIGKDSMETQQHWQSESRAALRVLQGKTRSRLSAEAL
jgi:hypothetical protein